MWMTARFNRVDLLSTYDEACVARLPVSVDGQFVGQTRGARPVSLLCSCVKGATCTVTYYQ